MEPRAQNDSLTSSQRQAVTARGNVLVMAGAHLVVWRYDALALSVVDCLNPDTTDVSCQPSDSPSPSDQAAAGSGQPSGQPSDLSTPTPLPTPIGTDNGATPAPTLPPWNGTDRLNILLVGTDQRNNSPSFNTDTTIVVSIDPKTKQVAMLQLPRDTANVPVPPVARSVWGTTYGSKINSWFAANQNLKMWPGKTATARGMAALESILGNLYGININYWVMVNFQGFTDAVNTLGGVQVNVQIPVAEDEFPLTDSDKTRLYIPAGPQEMDGQTALMYARSRHNSQGGDFDRGYRQQRVILSLKNELDPQTVFNNLTGLVQALKTSVKTNIPVTDAATMGKLLDLASRVDTKNIRSYVFAAPYYATDMYQLTGGTNSKVIINLPRVQSAVRQAFTLSPALITLRNTLSAEGAQVWVLDGKNGMGLAGNNAAYLDYYGMDASPLAQLAPTTPAATTITVYNGADTRLTATIRYLQNLYGATVKTAKSSTTKADIVIIIGMNAHSLTVPNAG